VSRKIAFIGFETKARDDWETYATPVVAPRNYKDPIKIAEYVDKARAQQVEDCRDGMLTGAFAEIRAQTVEVGNGDNRGPVAEFRLPWPEKPVLSCLRDFEGGLVVCRSKLFLQLAVAEAIDRDGCLPYRGLEQSALNDMQLKQSGNGEFSGWTSDPLRLLTNGDDPHAILRRWFPEIPVPLTAEGWCSLARGLWEKLGKGGGV
jgi:hypothetical protein